MKLLIRCVLMYKGESKKTTVYQTIKGSQESLSKGLLAKTIYINENNKRKQPVVVVYGVAEPAGRAELLIGWLALSEGKMPEPQGMM